MTDEFLERAASPDAIGTAIPVVCLGGSAGALDSFKRFFSAMSPETGAAFIVVQHLSPAHPSMLGEILTQYTQMGVVEAREGTPVQPNCIYVIPPNRYLSIRGGMLRLSEPAKEHGTRMSIDVFARSLAEDLRERAIFVLFSGADSDGTVGIRAVRGAGGLTIAQDRTAQFNEMPHSAVATGLVDLVLPPEKMPGAIEDYLRRAYVRREDPRDASRSEPKPRGLDAILEALRSRTGHDFRCYKQSTVLRRIERRMSLQAIEEIAQYGDLIAGDAAETRELDRDLLINVTAFFRDAAVFEELRQKAIIPLVQTKGAAETIRAWVPGCSSGEEAYSLAMLLLEEVETATKRCPVQVFATDIDEEALQTARIGVYTGAVVDDIGPNRLARFFIPEARGAWRVSEPLRDHLVFAAQNLISDPPFSRMDIISCRNLLIYIDADTQARLIPLFNYSLNTGGCLLLGRSEGIGGHDALFRTVSKKARIYCRLIPPRPITLENPNESYERKRIMTAADSVLSRPASVSYADIARNSILGHFAASLVLVNRNGQILQFYGQTGKYLNLPTGDPNLNLLDIAKEGLSLKIRSAMRQALRETKTAVIDNIKLPSVEDAPSVRITATPVLRDEAEPLVAVFFEDVPRPTVVNLAPPGKTGGDPADTAVVARLEDELRATQRDLQAAVEELQASNQDLRVANQEVVAMNEELQSSNEELETSKEELQSVNEELSTVNTELQDKVETLNKSNNDMSNFLSSTDIPTLFLDEELRIKLFTPAATRVFRLISSDVGRSIGDLAINFVDYDLPGDAAFVVQNRDPIEREVLHADGSSYLIRMMPYVSSEADADGVVLTFSDVTGIRRAEKRERRLAAAVSVANDAVVLVDLEGRIQFWNQGAQAMYGWSEEEALGKDLGEIVPADREREHIEVIERLRAGEQVPSFETQRLAKGGRVLDIWLTAAPVADEAGKMEALATVERDVTDRKRSESELKALNETLEKRAEQLRFLASELTMAEQHEQRRLAQVLHDGLQQILVGAKYQIALLEHTKDVPSIAAQIANLLDEAIDTSRSLTADLGPPILHHGGLLAGLEWLVGWMQAKHGLAVELVVPERIEPLTEGVFTLLFQAARELLFNAVKHAGVRTARVEVSSADGLIRLVVQDKGKGFDAGGVTAQPKGIGLLSLRERLSMMGGNLEVDSTPGVGSRFTITLPRSLPLDEVARAACHLPAVAVPEKSPRVVQRSGSAKIRVLLADDHTIVRQGLAGLINAEPDMEVAGEAADGEAAVALTRDMRPHVVLMDINMPGMNGVDAARIIHREFPDIRVIGLSMFREGEQAAAMREAGAVAYIEKSGPSDLLLKAVRAHC